MRKVYHPTLVFEQKEAALRIRQDGFRRGENVRSRYIDVTRGCFQTKKSEKLLGGDVSSWMDMNHQASGRMQGRLGVAIRVVLFLLLSAVMLAAFSPVERKAPVEWSMVLFGIAAAVGTFALTLLFVRWEGLCLNDMGAAQGRWSALRFVYGIGIGLILVAGSAAIQTVYGHVRWTPAPGLHFVSATIALGGFVALACREELAFRGYPLRMLERSFGVAIAQVVVALSFALEHRLGGWPWNRALLGAGVGSLVFGMAALSTRGLAVPIGMHAAWNFGASMIGQNYSSGIWRAVVEPGGEEQFQRIVSGSYLLVMGMAMVGFWAWGWKTAKIRSASG